MLTPEIIFRVDAWLASRKQWLSTTEYRDWLHHEWRMAFGRFRGCGLADGRAATASAMSGILLALVREAWGDYDIAIVPGLTGWYLTSAPGQQTTSLHGLYGYDTEADTLIAALEAAPQ